MKKIAWMAFIPGVGAAIVAIGDRAPIGAHAPVGARVPLGISGSIGEAR